MKKLILSLGLVMAILIRSYGAEIEKNESDNHSIYNASAITEAAACTDTKTATGNATTIAIASPLANALFIPGDGVTISAITNDVGGNITKVEFYVNGDKIGENLAAPYEFEWVSVLGQATLTAVSTDNSGVQVTSPSVVINVTEDIAPTVNITSPLAGDKLIAGNTVTITADAVDADGTVSLVEFYINGVKIGEDATAPYQVNWLSEVGTTDIKAIATDERGLRGFSTIVEIEVYYKFIPAINITSPAANALFFPGEGVTITALTNDVGNTVTKVAFYVNGDKIGEDVDAPYEFEWVAVLGTATLTAVSTGSFGVLTASPPVTINVTEDIAPTATITAPSAGDKFIAGNVIGITADAADADGTVSLVEFYINGVKIGEDATAPYQINWTSTVGTTDIKAIVTDNRGVKNFSPIVTIEVYDKFIPVINITSPAANALFFPGEGVTITALTNDVGNTVSKVAFYVNGDKIGEDLTAPYEFDWVAALGTATLTAVSTGSFGVLTTSPPVTINVTEDIAPTTIITAPSVGDKFIAGNVIGITADAADADGTVSLVEFYINGIKIGEDATAPYQVNWTSTVGTTDIKAIVTDNRGVKNFSAIVTVEVYDKFIPVINITSPTANASFVAGEPVKITAATNDIGNTVSKVEFYVNGGKVGEDLTAPYEYTWVSVSGTATLTAVSTGSFGVLTTSSPVTISIISNIAPTANITAPLTGSTVIAGTVVAITATAADADGTVTLVEFFVNGVKVGEDATAPYLTNWSSIAGATVITAVATDNNGAKTTSAAVTISVISNILPLVNITAPANNDIVKTGTIVNIRANATDADGTVNLVEFFINGTKIGQDATAPYQFNWTSVTGTAAITAIATDNKGGKTTSAVVTIAVVTNFLPSVNITSPAAAAVVKTGSTVTIRATATDADGTISLVEFYVNGAKVGQDAAAPYQFNWTSITGTATITAVATDNRGGKTTSATVTISVVTNFLPTVSITSPAADAIIKTGNTVTLRATAADADGTVSLVEFYINGTKVGQDVAAPYQFNWTAITGTATITAVVTDNKGGKTTSAAVTISVVTNFIPTVSIISPAAGAVVKAGNIVTIRAGATDADGTISLVEFYVNGTKVGQDATAPYQFNWTSIAGNASITAVATDNKGGKGNSQTVTISVVPNVPPVVNITSPAAAAVIRVGTFVTIRATASDADGSVNLVEFYVNDVKIGQDANAPYQYGFTTTIGTEKITVTATDNNGAQTSKTIVVSVNSLADNVASKTDNTKQLNVEDENADSKIFELTAYPNPFNNELTLTAKNPAEVILINVFDAVGRLVYTDKHVAESGKITFGNNLSEGLYTVQVISGTEVKSLKIIKKN